MNFFKALIQFIENKFLRKYKKKLYEERLILLLHKKNRISNMSINKNNVNLAFQEGIIFAYDYEIGEAIKEFPEFKNKVDAVAVLL